MKLSILIVNYKTPGLVLDCIASVFKFPAENIEIIVIDNASGDNLESMLKSAYPTVSYLQMGYNAGFARANNAGINNSSGDAVLLLNSDTIVKDNAINNCFKDFMASQYAACGVQLLNPDGSPQISGNYAMKGGLNYLLPLPLLGNFLKGIATIFKVKKPNVPEASGIVEVDWINGAFLMVKKAVIDQIGLLDEDFFLYAEEAEWCSRIKKAGRLCIYGDQHVIHLQGESANEAFGSEGKGYFNLFDKKGLQIMVSNFLRIRKEFGIQLLLFDLLMYLIEIPVFFFGVLFSKLFFVKGNRYEFPHWVAYCKNILKLLAHVPNIIMNRRYFYKIL
jgi:GT2 family glycosyltransferase